MVCCNASAAADPLGPGLVGDVGASETDALADEAPSALGKPVDRRLGLSEPATRVGAAPKESRSSLAVLARCRMGTPSTDTVGAAFAASAAGRIGLATGVSCPDGHTSRGSARETSSNAGRGVCGVEGVGVAGSLVSAPESTTVSPPDGAARIAAPFVGRGSATDSELDVRGAPAPGKTT